MKAQIGIQKHFGLQSLRQIVFKKRQKTPRRELNQEFDHVWATSMQERCKKSHVQTEAGTGSLREALGGRREQ